MRRNQRLISSPTSNSDPELEQVGFGCSVFGCDWQVRNIPFHEALKLRGPHNQEKHLTDTSSHIVWLYRRRTPLGKERE